MLKSIVENILKKKILISIIVFGALVVGISLGSAIITRTLSIGGKTKINDCDWNIHFEDITINPNSVLNTDSTKNARITDPTTKRNISFSTNLSSVGDFYEFDVYTVNDSNCDMDAMIDSIELEGITNEQKKYITYSIKYDDADIQNNDEYYSSRYEYTNKKLEKCDPLYEQTRRKIKVRVALRKEIDTDSLELNFNFKINYVQLDDSCTPTGTTKHTLKIEPNGGKYNDSSSDTTIQLAEGEDYELLTPTHDDFDFMLWEVISPTENGTYSFEHNKYFRMGEEDVTIRAKWDENFVASIGMCNFYQTVQSAFTAMKDGYTITEDKNGQKLYKDYTCNPDDKTVYLLKDHTETPTNLATTAFKFDLLGHTLTGNITNGSSTNTVVDLTLVNGKVISPSTGNEAVTNYGTLTMGEKDGFVNIENSITLIGNFNGIVNKENSIFKFYDGYIENNKKNDEIGQVIQTTKSSVLNNDERIFNEDEYHITIDPIDNEGKRAYLIPNSNRRIAKTTTLGNIEYYNLQLAIEEVEAAKRADNYNDNEYVIYATRDFEAAYELSVSDDSRIFFDTKGFNINIGENVTNNGYFKIFDSTNENNRIRFSKTITNNSHLIIDKVNIVSETDNNLIDNNGELELYNLSANSNKGYVIKNNSNGSVSLDENTTLSSRDNYAIINEASDFELNNGTVYGLYNKNVAHITGNVNLKSNLKTNSSEAPYTIYALYNTGTVNVDGGTFEDLFGVGLIRNSGIFNNNNYNLDLGSSNIDNTSGTVNVNGGTISSTENVIRNGLVNVNVDEVNKTAGTVSSTNGIAIADAVVKVYGKKIIVNNEELELSGRVYSDNIAISNNGSVYIDGGIVEGKNYGIISENVTVNSGKVISDNIGISASYLRVNDGEISGKEIGARTTKIEMYNGVIKSENGIGLENHTSNHIESFIYGGTIEGETYGIKSTTFLKIGKDDDNISTTSPQIKGGLYGLYSVSAMCNTDEECTVGFYDGVLIGGTDAYYGIINDVPQGSFISKEQDGDLIKAFISNQEDWLRVGSQTFNRIDDASQAIDGSGTIEVIKDANISFIQNFFDDESMTKNVTFDLNGHLINTSQKINNHTNLTIVDSSVEKTGSISFIGDSYFNNLDEMTINNGNYTGKFPLQNRSVMTINDANIESTEYGIYNIGNLEINNIKITSSKYGIKNYYGTIIFNDGEIDANQDGIYSEPVGNITVNNGKILSHNRPGIYKGDIVINGGEIYGTDGIFTNDLVRVTDGFVKGYGGAGIYALGRQGLDNVIIEGGEITTDGSYAISCTGDITVKGGNIHSNYGGIYARNENSNSSPNVTITDGTILGNSGPAIESGLGRGGGNLYIRGGYIESKRNIGVRSENKNIEIGYPIIKVGNALVAVGDDDSTETPEDEFDYKLKPVIVGKTYGLYANEPLNVDEIKFYRGIIKGQTKAHQGLITQITPGMMIKNDYEYIDREEYKTEYLVKSSDWIRMGDKTYNSITDAASEANPGDVMTVIADPYINFKQFVLDGEDVVLDLNGHSIILTTPIQNEGKLKIIDSTITDENTGGGITNKNDYVVLNKGELIVENGTYSSDRSYAFKNKGTLTMNGGNINTSSNSSYSNGALYNDLDSNFIMNNGNINTADTDCIYNYGNITINDGNIESSSVTISPKLGVVTINGGSIKSEKVAIQNVFMSYALDEGEELPSDYNDAKVYINDGYIYGKDCGLDNNFAENTISGGIIESNVIGLMIKNTSSTILGGTIYGKEYGIKLYYDSSVVTIGDDEGEISTAIPRIKGDLYGIYKSSLESKINFYDGILMGETDSTYNDIDRIATNSQLVYGNLTENSINYKTVTLYGETDLVKNLSTGVIYTNLQTAVNDVDNTNNDVPTLELLASAPLYKDLDIKNKKFILDMKGFSLSTNYKIINKDNSNVEIINTSSNKSSLITYSSHTLIDNTANLKINNIYIENYNTSEYLINNKSNMQIDNSTIKAKNSVTNTSNLTINNSNIASEFKSINNEGIMVIDGGTYTTEKSYSIHSNSSQNVTINNANITGTYYNGGNNTTILSNSRLNGKLQNYSSNMSMNNSRLYGNNAENIYNNGTLTLNNSEVSTTKGSGTVIAVENSGTLTINDSNINVGNSSENNSSSSFYGIRVTDSGQTNINNSNINIYGGNDAYGLYLRDTNSKIKFNTGNINIRNSVSSYGTYIRYGSYTMGVNDSSVSRENPMIYSYGINGTGVKKSNGEFNFYDGEIWATKYSKPETTSKVPENYEATTYVDEETGYEYCHLEYMPDDYEHDAIAIIEGSDTHYLSLQSAINASVDGDVIKMLRSTTETFEIVTGKNVVIDLNKHSITTNTDSSNNSKVGPFVVQTGASLNVYNGSLQSFDNETLINNGTFIMGEDDENVSSTNVRIVSGDKAIINNGTFIMYDGYLEGNPSIEGKINQIAEFSRIYTTSDEQSEKKYLQSLSLNSILAKETDLILSIDPNNGLYENSKDVKNVYLKYEDQYTLETPIKNGCTFTGWQTSVDGVLNGNIVTMGVEDVTLTATWDISPTAVAHIGDEYYESMESAITAANDNDEIIVLKDIVDNVTIPNEKNIIINLDNHKITGEFINNGTLKLLNGTIENTNGIGIVNNKTLTLGENDTEISENSIKIIGTSVGLEQNGRLNFYDGYVEGEIALDGSVTSVPQGFYIYTNHIVNGENTVQRVFLIGNPANAVAIIDSGTTQYFFNLQDAINASKILNREIKIIKDFEGSYPIEVKEDYDTTINMQGHSITLGSTITNNASLKIYDSAETPGEINIVNEINNVGTLEVDGISIKEISSNRTINNSGYLKLDNATITSTSATTIYTTGTLDILNDTIITSNSYYAIDNQQTEKLVINSGTISGITNSKELEIGENALIKTTASYVPCVYLPSSNAILTINGGTLEATNYRAIHIAYNSNNNIITINNGTITSKSSAIYVESANNITLNIAGGEITSTGGNTITYDYSYNSNIINTLNITGGTIKNGTSRNDRYCLNLGSRLNATISGDAKIITDNSSGIFVSGTNLTLDGTEIRTKRVDGYGIYQYSGTVNIEGNTKIITEGTSSIGIVVHEYDATLNINSGEITSNNVGIRVAQYSSGTKTLNINGGSISGDTYGISLNSPKATVNVGNNNNELSTTIPYITGGTYGIYKENGTLNFYSGRLRGITYGFSSELNYVRKGKDIAEELEYLEYPGVETTSTTNVSDGPISEYAKKGNGYAKITYLGENTGSCQNGEEYNFSYSGHDDVFDAPCAGEYKLEVWGAQGGNYDDTHYGGYGGYSTGKITLYANERLYVTVGGAGTIVSNSTATGGYNGGGSAITGGNSDYAGSGGGATHIATSSGLLSELANDKSSVIIVAGGGGGAYHYYSTYSGAGGSGGGYIGGTAQNINCSGRTLSTGTPASQTSPSTNNGCYLASTIESSFGQGSSYTQWSAGGGGGYYGGGFGYGTGASGGSGYVGNSRLSETHMYGYNVPEQIHAYMNNYLIEKDYFLQVGEETFNTFEDAIAAITDTGTIKVLKDITVQEDVDFVSGKTIQLDLNGHELTFTTEFVNNGDLTITDLTANKNGKIINTKTDAVKNNGNLEVDYVTIEAKTNSVIRGESGTGNIKIYNGATLIGNTATNNYGIYLASAQNVDINNSTITTRDASIYNKVNNSRLTITDSTLTSGTTTIYSNNNYLKVDITDSTIAGNTRALFLNGSSNVVNVTGGTFTATTTNTDYYVLQLYGNSSTYNFDGCIVENTNGNGIWTYNGNPQLTLNDVVINAKLYGIYTYGGTITIDGDTKITTTGTNSVGIYDNTVTSITMNSGEINSANIGISATNSSHTGSININSGRVIGSTYGISINIEGVTLNIGKSTDELSTTIPYIEGGKYGIYNTNGTVKFYSGRLVGNTFGYKNDIDYVRPKKSIYTELVLGEGNNPLTYTVNNVSDEPISEYAKAGNGYAKLTYLGETNGTCQNNQEYPFSYTGNEQTFTVPCEGNYKIEVWGAAGGYTSESKHGGYGGYSKGTIELDADETLYINVGGQGTTGEGSTGGYNGGGSGASSGGSGGGGGATHIATQSGLLQELSNSIESILIVAGGGGGYANWGCSVSIGGSGGGYQGALATNTSSDVNNTGGTQSNGGVSNGAAAGSFGLGGYQNVSSYSTPGAGSGFYGGGTGHDYCGAGGGSGYISNTRLSNGAMYGYQVPTDNTIHNYLVDKDGFLQVGEQVFNSLIDAIDAITDTGTIKVLNDGYIQEESIIPSGKNITIDLNGRTLNTTVTIINNGDLTITDLTNDKKGKLVNNRSDVIENNGNVTVKDITMNNASNTVIVAKTGTGNVVIDNSTLTGQYGVYLYSAQNVNISDSTITTDYVSVNYAVNNSNLTITNSTLNSGTTAIYSNNYSLNADITDSTISGLNRALFLNSSNNVVNVTGGKLIATTTNTDYYAVQLYGNSKYSFDGTIIESTNANGIWTYNGTPIVYLKDVEINAKLYGIYMYGGESYISGNTKIVTTGTNSYGIRVESATSMNFNSGEIYSENIGIGTVSYRDAVGEINISGGKIVGKTYGLATDIQNVNVNIVNYDDINSINEPYIEGGTYGIYRTAGTINFYSGRLVGQTKAYYDSINNIREGYEQYDDSEDVNNTEIQKDVLSTSSHSSEPLANTVKEGNGYAKITYTGQNVVKSKLKYEEYNYISDNSVASFAYTGSPQSFVPTFKGKYKIELWGAQGGYRSNDNNGGKGAYVSGYLDLDLNDELLVYVGASGNNGSYNGGGTRTIGHGGGGATDIRLTSSLYSRIMVAAGGGSDGADSRPGGYGGALEGQTRTESYGTGGGGATQTAGGSLNGEFGQGGDGISQNGGHGGAGGGGWYGGGATQPDGSVDDDRGGGGGSSFIYNATATLPNGYLVDSRYMVSDSLMFSGGESMPSSLGSGIVTGNKGNGLAKITLISIDGEYNEVHARFITEQGSVNQEIKTYDKNDTLGTLEVPTINNPNISFAGWYLEPTYENQVDSNYVITKDINLYAKFVYNNQSCSLTPGTTYDFNYTGSEQSFTAQCAGVYKIETWGAQGGGTVNDSIIGGYGAYASGELELFENDKIYINVGGQGGISTTDTVLNGGYNGGGNARSRGTNYSFGSGGGATHIATSSGLLKDLKDNKNSVIMVAAGGGGGGSYYTNQGNSGTSGGGVYSKSITNGNTTTGATKIGPGSGYKGQGGFGYGATLGNEYGPGAGSGYYGGGADSYEWGATGGSSYVDIDKLNDRKIYSYQIYDNEYANVVYLVKAHDIVKNTTTDTKYKNIQVAINEANTGETLELISDANISYTLTISSDDNITLDLNGYNLQTTKSITNNGIFNITNSNGNSQSKLFTTLTMSLIINNNNLNISNVTVSGTKTIDNSTNGVYVINNSNIIGTTYAIYDSSNTTNTITNSTVKATTNAIYIYSTAVVNTNGTNFEGVITTNNSSSELHITGGEIKGVISNVGQTTISTANIKNNTSLSYNSMIYNNGTMTLSNSNITHTSQTYYNYYCDFITNNGTLTSSNNNYKSLAGFNGRERRTIAILNYGLLTSTSDSFEMEKTNEAYILYNESDNNSTISNQNAT